jgi:hypothetical protein
MRDGGASHAPRGAQFGSIRRCSAAAHAQRAVAYLHNLQPKAADVEEAA